MRRLRFGDVLGNHMYDQTHAGLRIERRRDQCAKCCSSLTTQSTRQFANFAQLNDNIKANSIIGLCVPGYGDLF